MRIVLFLLAVGLVASPTFLVKVEPVSSLGAGAILVATMLWTVLLGLVRAREEREGADRLEGAYHDLVGGVGASGGVRSQSRVDELI